MHDQVIACINKKESSMYKQTLRVLEISIFLFIQGCSTVCFVDEKPNAEKVQVFYKGIEPGYINTELTKRVSTEEINEYCEEVSSYSYAKGPFLLDPSNVSGTTCINCKPECLVRLAKNDALSASQNDPTLVMLTANYYNMIHGGYSYDVEAYFCSEQINSLAKMLEKRIVE